MKNSKLLPNIGFAGLTHLGINSAVASAAKGFKTYCYHNDPKTINRLNNNDVVVTEPKLPDYFEKHKDNLFFSSDPKILNNCDIVYIAFDVPTNDLGESDLKPIDILTQKIKKFINSNTLLVILCQVPPGFTRKIEWPKNQTFYQVETLIFGQAIERALYPERIIFGFTTQKKILTAG